MGIKEFAVLSTGMIFKNINKTNKIRKLEKKLKREQRRLSRKYESLKEREGKKGEATRQNIQKQVLKVQRLHQRIENIRTDYISKCINKIVNPKPSYESGIYDCGVYKNRVAALLPCRFATQPLWGCHNFQNLDMSIFVHILSSRINYGKTYIKNRFNQCSRGEL